jgi:hypothetical protein
MFEMYFPKPIHSVNLLQLDASSLQANFYIYGEICHQEVIPIYSSDNPQTEDPEMKLAREQWNNLI